MRPFSGKISELPQKWRVFRTKTLLFGSLFPAHSASKNKMIEQGNLTRLKAIQTSPVARQAPSRYPDDWREVSAEEMDEMIELTREFRSILLPKLESHS